jgi:hypothetical protein
MAKHDPKEDKKLFDKVIELYENGLTMGKALEKLGKKRHQFYALLTRNPLFEDRLWIARARRADHEAEIIIEIADEDPDPQRARNRIQARQWYASKMKPERYGERLDLKVDGTVNVLDALQAAKQRVIDAKCRTLQEDTKEISDDTSDSRPDSDISQEK